MQFQSSRGLVRTPLKVSAAWLCVNSTHTYTSGEWDAWYLRYLDLALFPFGMWWIYLSFMWCNRVNICGLFFSYSSLSAPSYRNTQQKHKQQNWRNRHPSLHSEASASDQPAAIICVGDMIHFCVGSVFHIFMKDGGKGALHTGGKLKFDSNPRTYSKTTEFSL